MFPIQVPWPREEGFLLMLGKSWSSIFWLAFCLYHLAERGRMSHYSSQCGIHLTRGGSDIVTTDHNESPHSPLVFLWHYPQAWWKNVLLLLSGNESPASFSTFSDNTSVCVHVCVCMSNEGSGVCTASWHSGEFGILGSLVSPCWHLCW